MSNKKRKSNKKSPMFWGFSLLAVFMALVLVFSVCYFALPSMKFIMGKNEPIAVNSTPHHKDFQGKLETFALQNNLPLSSWSAKLIDFAKKYPETEDFVLNYPLKKDKSPKIDLSEFKYAEKMPLVMQWDERWGYKPYSDNIIGMSGCGPTTLSMVAMYLLKDPSLNPLYMAKFSIENGYCTIGNGTKWTLISEGGEKLGLNVTELPLVESRVRDSLQDGNPVICIMGPGDFTDNGHYIVMTEWIDGKIKVNDCNSRKNSDKLWEFDQIKDQIRNLWSCSK